jgi:DNA-binding XRE family transcriptional regulator
MTTADLQAWRSRLGLTAKAAAEALGLSINGYAAYERGYIEMTTDYLRGKPVVGRSPRPVPKHVALACERLEDLAKIKAV